MLWLIEKIRQRAELSAVIAKLQHITGARVHEIRIMKIAETTIAINKGKGGRKRLFDFSHRPDELAEVRNLMTRLKELSEGVNGILPEQGQPLPGPREGSLRVAGRYPRGAHGIGGLIMPRNFVRSSKPRVTLRKR